MDTFNITDENKKWAFQKLYQKKAFTKVFINSPPQTKVISSLIVPLTIGIILYSFVPKSLIKLSVFSFLSIIVGFLIYSMNYKYNEKWASLLAFAVGTLIWIYIFSKEYKQELEDSITGRKSFICSPSGVCRTDGTKGSYNGLKDYHFRPPGKKDDWPEESNVIPARQFDTKITDKFTFMFWLKIDYADWKNNDYGKDKIILLKGYNYENGNLSVWAAPTEDIIQFDIGTGTSEKLSMSLNFPFNTWVHYSVVVNSKVAEIYKNATLEQSSVLNVPIFLSQTPLYLGKTWDNRYTKFPGKMFYLTYINDNLMPGDIYENYKKEYRIISNFENANSVIKPEPDCPDCSADIPEDENIENNVEEESEKIKYAYKKSIKSPLSKIKEHKLMDRYRKYL